MTANLPIWTTILLAIIGSSSLFSFVQFIINRKDTKQEKNLKILTKIDKAIEDSKVREEKQNKRLASIIKRIIETNKTINNIDTKIQGIETRLDGLETKVKQSDSKLKEVEKALVRTQLLFLIRCFPKKTEQIMTVGENYFKTLKGDWYVTGLFNEYLQKNELLEPEWFHKTIAEKEESTKLT